MSCLTMAVCAVDVTPPPFGFFQSQLAEEIEKMRSELDQFRLRAGSLTDPTLSR